MLKCTFCHLGFSTQEEVTSHEATHKVKRVSDDPLVLIVKLPDECKSGGWEAAESFTAAIRELRIMYPSRRFQLIPFSLSGSASNNRQSFSNSVTVNIRAYIAVAD